LTSRVEEYRLLGPVEVRLDEQSVDIGYPRQRCALAALLADANRVLTRETIVERLWGERPPPTARNAVAGYLSRLRQVLERDTAARIVHRSGGYAIVIDPERVDLYRFRRMTADAEADHEPLDRAALLREALALWRGCALADLSGAWAATTRQAWEHERTAARLAYHDARLRCGDHAELLPELLTLTAEHPLDERLVGQLIVAEYRAGGLAAAIGHYQRARARLADELGVDPSPQLRELYERLLRNDPTLDPPAARVTVAGPAAVVVPAQLPLGVGGFTGRARELAILDALLDEAARQPATTVVCAVLGTAGIGKTTLAVHWAHRVADRFPDGQLYVNLRGFEPSGSVMAPAEAVRRFLDAFEVPPERTPAELEAQVGLYRSLLAGKRVLVVLDNAETAEQVRPLLPGAPGCFAVVTCRNTLTGLVAVEDARPITLDLLTADEAQLLLTNRIGPERSAAEPAAVERIITRCARLPLALAITAARAATQPRLSLRRIASDLDDARVRLGARVGDDPYTDLRAVFSWSYQALSGAAARVFRLLGLHPGPDFGAPAVASLAALPPSEVPAVLSELTGANLLVEDPAGRYTCHDLLRAYATELAQHTEREDERRAAVHRLLDHYLHVALAGDRLLSPTRDRLDLAPPQPGVVVEAPTDHESAMAWFAMEHRVAYAVTMMAADTGFDTHVWQLSWALNTFLARRGHRDDCAAMWHAALAAARRLGDSSAQARAYRILAVADDRPERLDRARGELQCAIDLCRTAGDRLGQAHGYYNMAFVCERQGRYREAIGHAERAFALYEAVGHHNGQAQALNAVGWYRAQLGDYEPALSACEAALTLYRALGDRNGQANTWHSIGYAHHQLGRHAEAADCHRNAVALYRELGDRFYEAATLDHLGDAHMAAGDSRAARAVWRRAVDMLTDLHHPFAEQVDAKLRTVAGP
jgi:DNA-binding SARP family transcriptional activator